ncbi:MAG: RNA methyltransferase [Vulcanococcus sp.]|jgi:TrmH family RNA methyltransferase|uniref:TrmH family RNA methyltransferase n=1 Tax=Vulcanococcus sp. TaxID=2856995 RepID=UPI0025FDD2BA|nr:RNA methyltransferase [Vulcanococcus sp.]MBW0174340.1 RNA methyltransferase [Vulcanococcus sp.]MBW0181968.1 RNA methyltransferase [Vulcanococcus sp.]
MELITSRRNPLVGRLRALHQPKGRREQGLLLLEGTHQLQELLRLGLQPEQVLATPAWIERNGGLLAQVALPLQPVGEEVMAAVATTDHPDGVVATLAREALPVARGEGAFVLVLDQLQDPGNLGTLLRTALAAGVDEVWLGGGADPLQPKVLRASAGAALALPLLRLAQGDALLPLLQRAVAAGQQLVATVVQPCAQPYWQLDWTRPTILMMGNEGAGLHPQLAALATHRITIPHSDAVESLNVAVAAAPLLLERWRQERNAAAGA